MWSPLFPMFPIESRVANVFPLVPCVPYFSPSVSRLFLVFRVGNLWEATSCRANTIYTETVSIAYSVPSSQCVPNCVLCSLCVSFFLVFSVCSQCVPYCVLGSQFLLFSVCFECVPSVIPTVRCVHSQCACTLCVPYVPSAFPQKPF